MKTFVYILSNRWRRTEVGISRNLEETVRGILERPSRACNRLVYFRFFEGGEDAYAYFDMLRTLPKRDLRKYVSVWNPSWEDKSGEWMPTYAAVMHAYPHLPPLWYMDGDGGIGAKLKLPPEYPGPPREAGNRCELPEAEPVFVCCCASLATC